MGRDYFDFNWSVGAENSVRVSLPVAIDPADINEIECFLELVRCRARRIAGLPYGKDLPERQRQLVTGLDREAPHG